MENGDKPIHPTLKRSGELAITEGGLTKREAFAMAAMQGLIGNSNNDVCGNTYQEYAEKSVKMADALLKEFAK